MANGKRGGLTVALPKGEALLLVWPDGTQTHLDSHGLMDSQTLWLSMPDKDKPPFLRSLMLRLGKEVEPFPGVRMTFIEVERKRINIQAPRDRVTVLRGGEVRQPVS